jgi:hypothetical protein
MAGGALLTYMLPDNEDLLSVKAMYEPDGDFCKSRTSLYKASNTAIRSPEM